MSQNIKTWQERLPDGIRFCPSVTEAHPAMLAEIADLRAALAARTGGERAAAALEEAAREVEGHFIGYRREDAQLVEIAAAIRALAAQPAQQADMASVQKDKS